MKKLLVSVLIMIGFISANVSPIKGMQLNSDQQKPIPPYAKWGTYAMQKTKEKYPNAEIHDYQHIGRIVTPNTSTERFKLWLKEKNKEFGVYIDIEFDNKTEQVIKVTFKETTR